MFLLFFLLHFFRVFNGHFCAIFLFENIFFFGFVFDCWWIISDDVYPSTHNHYQWLLAIFNSLFSFLCKYKSIIMIPQFFSAGLSIFILSIFVRIERHFYWKKTLYLLCIDYQSIKWKSVHANWFYMNLDNLQQKPCRLSLEEKNFGVNEIRLVGMFPFIEQIVRAYSKLHIKCYYYCET